MGLTSKHKFYYRMIPETDANYRRWTFVGEWSAAMTDCAYALNGKINDDVISWIK